MMLFFSMIRLNRDKINTELWIYQYVSVKHDLIASEEDLPSCLQMCLMKLRENLMVQDWKKCKYYSIS